MTEPDECTRWLDALVANPNGARAELRQLLSFVEARLWRWFGRRLSEVEVRSLASKAVFRIFRRVQRARSDGEDFTPSCGYLAVTARNIAIDYFRSLAAHPDEDPTRTIEPTKVSRSRFENPPEDPDPLGFEEHRLWEDIAARLRMQEAWSELLEQLLSGKRLEREPRELLKVMCRERARWEIEEHARVELQRARAGSLLMEIDRIPHGNEGRLKNCLWIRAMMENARETPTAISEAHERLTRDFERRDLFHPAPQVRRQIGRALARAGARWIKLVRKCFGGLGDLT